MQQPLSETEKDDALERLKHHHVENTKCFDCGKGHPTWASVYLGIFLCMNCAGHHREYGVQYSFTHSFQLDSWTPRQLLFLELGGNANAHEYFKKHGQKAPYDYKSPVIQNYKNELTKKVDAAVKAHEAKDKEAQYNKGISMSLSNLDHFHHEEEHASPTAAKKKEDPFANMMSASLDNLDKTKKKVDFSHSGRNSSSKKGGLSAKRIDDIDINSLTLDDESNKFFAGTEMTGQDSGVKEVISAGNASDQSKFESLRDAKGISSDVFKENQNILNQPADEKDAKTKTSEKKATDTQGAADSKGILSRVGGKVGGGIVSLGGNISSLGGALKTKVGSMLQKKKPKENIE